VRTDRIFNSSVALISRIQCPQKLEKQDIRRRLRMRSAAVYASVQDARASKVIVVYCIACQATGRSPDTPRKITIVYLADKVLEKGPIPEFKAQQLTEQVLHQQIVNDPAFRGSCHWEFEAAKMDLSDFGTPDLTYSDGSKVWLK
jgi:hypothetical protein